VNEQGDSAKNNGIRTPPEASSSGMSEQ